MIGLQFLVTWTSVRVSWVQKWVTGEPMMLLYQGKLLPNSLRKARVTNNEIRAAIRNAGAARLEEVAAVVLETDGPFSVIQDLSSSANTSLEGVKQ